jgi:hypothetical protein
MKRKYLFGVLALAVAVAVSGIAVAANQQTLTGKVKPKRLPLKKRKPVALKIVTTLQDPTAPDGTPDPATRAKIDFDNAIVFNFKRAGTCSAGQIATQDTAGARAACRSAWVGASITPGNVRIPGAPPTDVPITISVFNGVPSGGLRTILLHSFSPALPSPVVLTGTVRKAKRGKDYRKGRRLVVEIPPLPFGAAITRFEAKIGTGFKKGYVKANCSDKNRRINFAGKFIFETEPAQTVFSKQRCRVKR